MSKINHQTYINSNGVEFIFYDNGEISVSIDDKEFHFKNEKEMVKKLEVKDINEIDSMVLMNLMYEEYEE